MPSLPRVLCLATHPDDEDGLALLYLKNKFNCQTYILLATRGEAGDDKILPVFDNDLGFLRMEEEEKLKGEIPEGFLSILFASCENNSINSFIVSST